MLAAQKTKFSINCFYIECIYHICPGNPLRIASAFAQWLGSSFKSFKMNFSSKSISG